MSLVSYAIWHYGKALKTAWSLWGNFIAFVFNFFSIRLLLKTYFSKFGRLGEKYRGGLDLENLLSTFVINTLMRIVGVLVRTVVILTSLVAIILVVISGLILYVIWLALPLVVLITLVYGLTLLI